MSEAYIKYLAVSNARYVSYMLSHHLLWLNKPLIITKNCISLEGISPLWHPSSLASAQSRVKKRGREGERDGEHITLYYWAMHLVSDGGVICVKKVALFSADPHISAGTTWVGTLLRNLCAWKWQRHCAFVLFLRSCFCVSSLWWHSRLKSSFSLKFSALSLRAVCFASTSYYSAFIFELL